MRRWIIPSIYGVFLCISTITLSSIAPDLAGRQLAFFLVGGGLILASHYFSLSLVLRYRWLLYGTASLGLLIPFIFSMTTRGTVRWIQFADGLVIQPSQFTLAMTLPLLLWLLTNTRVISWTVVLRFLGLLIIPVSLIVLQPDLDTAIVMALSAGSMLIFAGISWQKIGLIVSASVLIALIGWLFLLQPYQKSRITSFLSAQAGESHNYNAQQALIAVGAGGMFGVGLGQGTQSHLRFLPERHTDFIFSSLSEEYGFIGASLVIALYAVLIGFLIWEAAQFAELAPRLLLLACAVLFGTQAGINIGMNVGVLPIAGITLPFLSYGGSAILGQASLLSLAQLVIHRRQKQSVLTIG